MELHAVADTLLVSFAFLAVLGAGWLVSWPVSRAAHRLSHKTGFHDRSTVVAATARWTVRLIAILVAFAYVGIAAIAVFQLLLVGAVAGAAVAGGIAVGFAGRDRIRDRIGVQKNTSRRLTKPLPQLGRKFEEAAAPHYNEPDFGNAFEPPPGNAVLYGLPQDNDWIERANADRRAPKTRFDWGLMERRGTPERRTVS